jgi:predicted aldo/keto reductase-like oxidoreductase
MEVCPKNIPIPQLFGLYNNYKINNNFSNMYHNRIIYNRGKSSDCLNCHRCEKNCPQHIAIPDNLKKIAAFEK